MFVQFKLIMKAIVVPGPKHGYKLQEVPDPKPDKDEVVISCLLYTSDAADE